MSADAREQPGDEGTASIRCDECFLLTARKAERKKVLVSEEPPVLCPKHFARIQEHARGLTGSTRDGSGTA